MSWDEKEKVVVLCEKPLRFDPAYLYPMNFTICLADEDDFSYHELEAK